MSAVAATAQTTAAPAGTARPVRRAVGLVLIGIVSVQVGATAAAGLFPRVGPTGAVTLRLVGAAVVLLALLRPRLRGRSARDFAVAGAFGASLASMNLLFYEALARLPLGAAVTIEFLGPLGLAVVLSRRLREIGWVLLAGTGVVLLGRASVAGLDPVGVACALVCGLCWAAYIMLSAATGRRWGGVDGLAVASGAAALLILPVGAATAGPALLDGHVLAVGATVALLSAVVPYACELVALRTLPARTFGVLLSLEPVAAALAGLAILHQALTWPQVAAIGLVVVASAGATRSAAATAAAPLTP